MGTAGSWLLLDITFYGNGLFSGDITELMGLGNSPASAALNALYIALIALPGYFLAITFLDRIGRKRLQWASSLVLAMLYIIIGTNFSALKGIPSLFLILYGMTFLFSNFGANTTTYIIPGEFFPAEVRASCHGISAAAGKVGAAIAAYSFPVLKKDSSLGVANLLIGCGIIAFIGAVWTWFLVPEYSPEDLESVMKVKLTEYHAELERLARTDVVQIDALDQLGIATREAHSLLLAQTTC